MYQLYQKLWNSIEIFTRFTYHRKPILSRHILDIYIPLSLSIKMPMHVLWKNSVKKRHAKIFHCNLDILRYKNIQLFVFRNDKDLFGRHSITSVAIRNYFFFFSMCFFFFSFSDCYSLPNVITNCTSYELLFIARFTSCCLLHKLRVTFCIRVTSYCLLHELRVTL